MRLTTPVSALQRLWSVCFFFFFLKNCLRTCAYLMRAQMNPSGLVGSEGRNRYLRKTGGLYWDSEGFMWNSFHSLIGLLAFPSTYPPLQRSQRLACCQISSDITWFAAGLPLKPIIAATVWHFSCLRAAAFLVSFGPRHRHSERPVNCSAQCCTDVVISWQSSCHGSRF